MYWVTRELDQQLKAFAALPDDTILIPKPTSGNVQLPVTPAPRYLTPSGLHQKAYIHANKNKTF